MLFSNDRTELRRTFQTAWRKRREGQALEPLEALIAEVVELHPEYHAMLESPDGLGREWTPESGQSNPFLHLGMHIAIREQVNTDRPAGIAAAYRLAQLRRGDVHAVEHAFMECLGEALWNAQRAGTAPDEQAYLECLRHV